MYVTSYVHDMNALRAAPQRPLDGTRPARGPAAGARMAGVAVPAEARRGGRSGRVLVSSGFQAGSGQTPLFKRRRRRYPTTRRSNRARRACGGGGRRTDSLTVVPTLIQTRVFHSSMCLNLTMVRINILTGSFFNNVGYPCGRRRPGRPRAPGSRPRTAARSRAPPGLPASKQLMSYIYIYIYTHNYVYTYHYMYTYNMNILYCTIVYYNVLL